MLDSTGRQAEMWSGGEGWYMFRLGDVAVLDKVASGAERLMGEVFLVHRDDQYWHQQTSVST